MYWVSFIDYSWQWLGSETTQRKRKRTPESSEDNSSTIKKPACSTVTAEDIENITRTSGIVQLHDKTTLLISHYSVTVIL